ncbi:hypothetical protein [Thalassovita sp.]|uniref:hypothetical protein n=1 Tax=Thalassovita sp. TaxID=1979401 RepID=UPI002B275A2F|nr:hypothetical protein [Thalassovita sp.]
MKFVSGIGLAGLLVALVGLVTPVVGLFIGWLALGISALGAFLGDRGFAIATVIISAFSFLFFTPSLWLEAAASAQVGTQGTNYGGGFPILRYFSLALLAFPIAAMFVGKKKQA